MRETPDPPAPVPAARPPFSSSMVAVPVSAGSSSASPSVLKAAVATVRAPVALLTDAEAASALEVPALTVMSEAEMPVSKSVP